MSETEPQTKRVRAIDVKPYLWGIWCTVGDCHTPFTNVIELCSWDEDGKHIWWMLGTHNFRKARWDEEVELVPCEEHECLSMATVERDYAKFLSERPAAAPTAIDAGATCSP